MADEKRYENIYERFKVYHRHLFDRAVDWWPSGPSEIVVKLEDGSLCEFCCLRDTIRFLNKLIEDDGCMNEDNWRVEFRLSLIRRLHETSLTQKQLAEKTGITECMINRYFTGKAIPNAHNLYKISKVLGCDIKDLCDFDRKKGERHEQ